jgi:Uma2 family endonuclease
MATTKTRITADEYHKLPETTQPMELIDGDIIVSPTPKLTHQMISMRLSNLLAQIVTSGMVIAVPMDVYLDSLNAVQPDVFWVSGPDSLCKRGEDDYLYGAPDLVCEILSPRTAVYDKREKFALYEKHGVKEYWLLDQANQWIEVYTRQEEKLILSEVYHQTTFTSPLLQREIDTHVIFAGWFE